MRDAWRLGNGKAVGPSAKAKGKEQGAKSREQRARSEDRRGGLVGQLVLRLRYAALRMTG
jgi:hypothetical protein